jgi:CheY-like chemotaxis protein
MSPSFLVVDDHELYRTSFCSLLELCCPDAQIVQATNASQALALFPQQQWDAVILDYQLPTLSGSDIARRLRAQAQAQGHPLPPLIMMSTQPDASTFARAIGAVAFLPKPVDLGELQQALEDVRAAHPERSPEPTPIITPAPAQRQLASAPLRRLTPTSSSRVVQLRTEILQLLHQTIRRFPPPYPPARTAPTGGPNTRVGDYLVSLGYMTAPQLARVVRTLSPQPTRGRVPFGFSVVARDLVPAAVISAVLLQQFRNRLVHDPAAPPRFIGELLLLQGELTTAQLATALQDQLDLHRGGQWVRLSEIIIHHGWRDPSEPETPVGLIVARR